MNNMQKLLIVTSTLPASSSDPVPAFVSDQVSALKQLHSDLDIHVLAPHNAYAKTHTKTKHQDYTEYRFHYLWPHRFELLTGRGIAPALKAHKWLYAVVPFLFLCEAIATYRSARRLKPDVLYLHWFMPQAVATFLVARRLHLPLVFTTHASDVAVLKKIPGAKKLVRAICRQTVACTAVSQQTADRLRYFWPADGPERAQLEAKLSIIPMGTDLPKTATPAAPTSYPGKQVITFIGRLVGRKGVADLLTAFQTIHQTFPDTVLIVAGEGQDRDRFETLARQAGLTDDACIFPGYVSGQTKTDLLARTDILCLPSINDGVHAEGLPVVFMEGLAAGKITVASNVTGAQECVQSGINGYIFPEHDTSALTQALQTVLQLPVANRQAVQAAARELAHNFSWPKVAEQQYTVLQDAYHAYHSA